MAAELKGKKRKSGDNIEPTTKKVKTTKSADKSAPLKSALKKAKDVIGVPADEVLKKKIEKKVEEKVEKPAKPTKTKTTKPTTTTTTESEPATTPQLTATETAALLAGFSSDSESDEPTDASNGIALSSLPAVPKPTTTTSDPESTPGVIYISRLPHGFHEPQLRSYFTQFGTVLRLRLARNRLTGASQHHAFIEFASASVATIAAKTMDKYLLFGHVLQCRVVPADGVKEEMWGRGKGLGRKGGRAKPRNRIEGAYLCMGLGKEGWGKRVERERGRREGLRSRLSEMGYEFDVPGVKGVEEVEGQKEVEDVEEGGVALAVEEGEEKAKKVDKVAKRKSLEAAVSGKKSKKAKTGTK